ncbi:increased DNA methylation [Salix suchowensis]|nr:increased DNA methylation [Salix suchowensis]
MEEGRRSGNPSGYIMKNRSSSGCLIVRKKGNDGVGSSGSHKVFESKKEKKRLRVEYSDSGSSDELLMPRHRKVGPEALRACNGLSGYVESDTGRKGSRGEDIRRSDAGLIVRNGEDLSKRKRNKLDVFEFDEYDGNDVEMLRRQRFEDGGMEGRRYLGSAMAGRSGSVREYESGSSRHAVVDRTKSSYSARSGGLSQGGNRGGARSSLPFLRGDYDSDEPIRVQGKNGVLKVMVNKKKKVSGSLNSYDRLEADENRKGVRTEDTVKRNVLMRPPVYYDPKSADKAGSASRTEKNSMNKKKSVSTKSVGPKKVEARDLMKTPLSKKKSKDRDMDSDDSDTSLKLGPKNSGARKSVKGTSSGGEKTPHSQLPEAKIKEGKVKRGSGTEKQKLREQIREMLLDSGWTIDYRPRRNRDYLDAVYINPTGTAYWSIIKAYDALLKQSDEDEARSRADGSPFTPLADEVLSQLTRKTKKKIEKEMKRKKRDVSDSEDARETAARKSSSTRGDEESLDSGSREEKLSSFLKRGGKSLKSRTGGNGFVSMHSKGDSSTHHLHDSIEKPPPGSNSHHGRKSRKLGRCTLLVRNSNEGTNSDSDGFVPYSGKRTLLSWLIDCGTVQLSEKVRYMNRRRTKVMLEGWVTRDGIHCGCCSKILTVSKFEIHAGSKLRQPFQNIYLESGASLLDCQIEAWNRQESVKRLGFQAVDVDGNDPNDDTCGLCGDGGDLICCDGCPSTFHQSCLDIKMLPPGDWHCPNCSCKFCGVASDKNAKGDDTMIFELLTCSLCVKKYHKSCMQEIDTLSIDTNSSAASFCGKKCRELFEQLQKYLGVKHELEAGFSWSLIHRTDADSDTSLQGIPQRVECNSKLAVSLSVMDECFLPIVDRRSGINLIHNVLYNCGSNFNRLNYGGFYALILERGDEIISAASIRFHGTRLAEMPFIGTRHMYRRQGMCRRLLMLLKRFSVGHDPLHFDSGGLESPIGKNEVASASPDSQCPDVSLNNVSTLNSSLDASHGLKSDASPKETVQTDSESEDKLADSPLEKKSECISNTTLDVHEMVKSKSDSPAASPKETVQTDSESEDKLADSPVEKKSECISNTTHDVHEMVKSRSDSPADDTSLTCIKGEMAAMNSDTQVPSASLGDASVMSGSLDASCELKNAGPFDGTSCTDSESGGKISESASIMILDVSGERQGENMSEMVSLAKDKDHSCTEGEVNHVHAVMETKLNGLATKVEKSRKQLKERKNRSKKVRGVKKTKAGDAAKKK